MEYLEENLHEWLGEELEVGGRGGWVGAGGGRERQQPVGLSLGSGEGRLRAEWEGRGWAGWKGGEE